MERLEELNRLSRLVDEAWQLATALDETMAAHLLSMLSLELSDRIDTIKSEMDNDGPLNT